MDLIEEISVLDLTKIKLDLIQANIECSQRGLKQSTKWTAELNYALDQVNISDVGLGQFYQSMPQDFLAEYDRYLMAKSYQDLEEYDRAAHFTKNCASAKSFFIHIYSRYLAGEKRKIDDSVDTIGPQDSSLNEHLKMLRSELHWKHKSNLLDGYCLYVYGIVLKKLELTKEALDVLVEAVNLEPMHWGGWLELSLLVTDRDMLNNLALPDHWMRYFFLAQTYLELQQNEESLKYYQALVDTHFSRSTFIMAQIAMAYHNLRDVEMAVEAFDRLQQVDPYRLDNMDTYSNLLYVKEMKAEMAYLAHHCSDIDKYRVETCCIIGNYYSLRGQHEKAVLYFQRALKVNPNYLSAWTLMGHEYMELKHTSAAIQAYRQAVEVNRRDYRAWYGLGQTYEILKMPFYSLYYYKQAQMLRPNDSRMAVALGEAYDNLGRLQEAKRCYWKARSLGDIEGLALIKLARLYEKLSEADQAAGAFTCYINETNANGLTPNYEDLGQAYKFLANYHLKGDRLEEAFAAAQRCTDFRETREEGKALLRQISQMRADEADASTRLLQATESFGLELGEHLNTPHANRFSPMSLTYNTP